MHQYKWLVPLVNLSLLIQFVFPPFLNDIWFVPYLKIYITFEKLVREGLCSSFVISLHYKNFSSSYIYYLKLFLHLFFCCLTLMIFLLHYDGPFIIIIAILDTIESSTNFIFIISLQKVQIYFLIVLSLVYSTPIIISIIFIYLTTLNSTMIDFFCLIIYLFIIIIYLTPSKDLLHFYNFNKKLFLLFLALFP